LSTPTLALPHRRGRGLLGRFEISFVNHYRLYNYGLISKSAPAPFETLSESTRTYFCFDTEQAVR